MNRREFINRCSGTCLAFAGISILQACASVYYADSTAAENKVKISKSEFLKINKENSPTYRKSIVVKPIQLNFPIIVFRSDEKNYRALLLQCTHQGVELTVNGDILTCQAHGSEFSNKGEVVTGPADKNLKSYTVTSDEKNIYIQLT